MPSNVLQKALLYYKCKAKDGTESPPSLLRVLQDMIRTGLFYPSSKWLAPCQGSGMDVGQAAAAWDMLTAPQSCSAQDVYKVFFARNPFNHSTPRYFETDPVEETEVDIHRKHHEKWVLLEQLPLIAGFLDRACSSVDANAADALVAFGLQISAHEEPSAPPEDDPPAQRSTCSTLVARCRHA